jgi:hypothetical protein
VNPEIKDLWINALESGEFEQGRGALNRNGEFCCLGVLCELAYRSGVLVKKEKAKSDYVNIVKYDGMDTYLPNSVEQWAGIDSSQWESIQMSRLIRLNDSGVSFSEIAIIIKENL